LFLDRLPDRRRERAWRHVRQQTFEILHGHIIAFAVRCWRDGKLPSLLLPEFLVPLGDADSHSAPVAIASLRRLAEEVRVVGASGQLPCKQILDGARWDLGQVTDILTPAVMSLSSDTVLVERLVRLSRSVSRSQLAIYLEDSRERTGVARSNIAWQPIADTLDAASDVFERMAEQPA
jgi:hypothetical protein